MRKFLLGSAIIILLLAVGCEKKPELPYYTVDNAGELSIYSQSFPVPDKKLFQIPDKAVINLWATKTSDGLPTGYFIANINGETYNFIFDTGYGANILFANGIRKLGLSANSDEDYYILLKSMEISNQIFKDILFLSDLKIDNDVNGFDGIIGKPFFRKAKSLKINFPKGIVEINPTLPLSESIPIINRKDQPFDGDVIIEDSSIDGKKCTVAFDTGMQYSIILNSNFNFEKLNINGVEINMRSYYAEKNQIWYYHDINKLRLGTIVFENIKPYLFDEYEIKLMLPDIIGTGIDVLLGPNDFFNKAELTIDFIDKRCWITKVN